MSTIDYQELLEGFTEQEKKVFCDLLKSSTKSGELNLTPLDQLYAIDYEEIPVTIDRFIADPYYMGDVYNRGDNIYPYWKDFMHRAFHQNPRNAWEIAFTGSIGTGKSTIASLMMTYLLYRTLCLHNPQQFYGLTANSPIVFVVLNLTLDLAYDGLYSLIVESIKLSPWFLERVDIRGKYNYSIQFPNNIHLMVGSNVQHTIGKNVLSAVLDELNFSNAPKGSKNSVLDMYRNIRRRMESRFLKAGRQPGMLFLVSSKNTDYDFLEQHINSVRHQHTTWVVDEAIYNIKPADTYLGPKFMVAVGDKTKSSLICNDGDHAIELADLGYDIIEVPIEYRSAFEDDMNQALKEIAGLSAFSTSKLIPYAGRIEKCVDTSKPSPIASEIIHLGMESKESIRDYVTNPNALLVDKHIGRYAHIDIGLKGDRLGLAIVHPSKETVVEKYTSSGAIEKVAEMVYETDVLLAIQAVGGSEIPLYKVREFLFWLHTYAWKLELVTFDGFQSADSIQLLNTAGIESKLQSVDRSDEPYLNLRAAILEERIIMHNNSLLLKELYDLEYDSKNKKVDHPSISWDNLPGSKDLSDALAGAIYGAQQSYAKTKGGKLKHTEHFQRSYEGLKYLSQLDKIDDPHDYDWINV